MGRASLAAASASSRRAWSTVWAASCSRRSASATRVLVSASRRAAFASAALRIRSASVLASDRSFCACSRAFADSPVGFLVDPLFAPRGLFDLFVRFFLRFGGQGLGFGPRLAEDGPGFRFGLVEDGLAFGLGAVDHVLHVDADVLVGVRRLVFELLVLLLQHGQTLVELPVLGLPRVVLAFEPDDLGLVERAASFEFRHASLHGVGPVSADRGPGQVERFRLGTPVVADGLDELGLLAVGSSRLRAFGVCHDGSFPVGRCVSHGSPAPAAIIGSTS